jgi:hypothetical protein
VVVRWDFGLGCGYDFYFCWSLTEKLGSNFVCGYGHVVGLQPVKETFPSARVMHLATSVEEGSTAVRARENGMENIVACRDPPYEGKEYDP